MDNRARHIQNQTRYMQKLTSDPNSYLGSATHGCELCVHLAECRQLVRTMAQKLARHASTHTTERYAPLPDSDLDRAYYETFEEG